MASPPFADLSEYAARLAEEVPDTKAGPTDEDFVRDGVRLYASDNPLMNHADVGDGSTFEWKLGVAPFATWESGFSDRYPLKIQELDAADAPLRPPVYRRTGYWIEDRTPDTGPAEKFLVMEYAPGAGDKLRVSYRVQATLENIPVFHQMAVVYLAAAEKCAALSSKYRSMVDDVGGTDVFSAVETADAYEREEGNWRKRARKLLHKSVIPQLTQGKVYSGRRRVFRRWIP